MLTKKKHIIRNIVGVWNMKIINFKFFYTFEITNYSVVPL